MLHLYYKLSYYHPPEKDFFKLKAQILLYKLFLDQEKHKLLQAEYKAPPKRGGQVQYIRFVVKQLRRLERCQRYTFCPANMPSPSNNKPFLPPLIWWKRDFQNLTWIFYHAHSTCTQGEESSSCVHPVIHTGIYYRQIIKCAGALIATCLLLALIHAHKIQIQVILICWGMAEETERLALPISINFAQYPLEIQVLLKLAARLYC